MIINYPTHLYKQQIEDNYITIIISSTEPLKQIDETVPFINIQLPTIIESKKGQEEIEEIIVSGSTNIDSSEFFSVDDIVFSDEIDLIPENIIVDISNKKNIYGEQYIDPNLTLLYTNLERLIIQFRNSINEYNELERILVDINRQLTHITVIDQISDIIEEDVKNEIQRLQDLKEQTTQQMDIIRIEIFLLISKIKKLKNAL